MCWRRILDPHAEQILIPKHLVAKIPANITFEQAMLPTIGSIAMRSYRLSNVQIGGKNSGYWVRLGEALVVQILKVTGCDVIAYNFNDDMEVDAMTQLI